MATNESELPFDVTLESAKSTISAITTVVDLIVLYGIAIIEALSVILILYNIKRKNPTFTSIYYWILAIGYFLMSFNIFMFKITYTVQKPDIYRQSFYNIIQWYNSRFQFFWNVILAFNRFTAIFFALKHKKIWSGKMLIFVMAILLLWPFISSSYTLGDIGCFFKNPYDGCLNFFLPEYDNYIVISTSIVAFVLGVITALARKIKGQTWAKKQKFETYLLVQSFISSSLFLIYSILDRIASNYAKINEKTYDTNAEQYITLQVLLALVNYFALSAHCSSIILNFSLSKAVRESFISFYRLYYIPGIKKPNEATSQSFQTTSSVTTISRRSVR